MLIEYLILGVIPIKTKKWIKLSVNNIKEREIKEEENTVSWYFTVYPGLRQNKTSTAN